MAEKFSFFDPVLHDGLPDREYNAQEFTDYFASLVTTGIMKGAGAELKVTTNGSNMVTEIDTGIAFIEGRFYANTSKLAHTHDTESLGKSRIDRIVIRLDLNTEARHVRSFVKKGVGSASPVPPVLTRTDKVYEISVAQVKVIGGQTYINVSDVIDERENESVCGWAGSKILPNFDAEGLQAVLDAVNGHIADTEIHLSSRSGKYCALIMDWNNAKTNGWFMGNNAKNQPPQYDEDTWFMGEVIAHNDQYIVQRIVQFTDPKLPTYTRACVGGSWGEWELVVTSKLEPEVIFPLNAGYEHPASYTGIKPLSFFKDPFGIVHLQGYVHKNSGAGTTVGFLPVGYRPDKDLTVYGTQSQLNETNSAIFIRPNGEVAAALSAPAGTSIFATFRAYN